MYTDEKNVQIILSLFKKYNIRKIVVSPGTTNIPVAASVQKDSFFEVFSVVDERSAAYFATGLSFESNEPVVLSCTGATASRNYLSGLTEAYYRNLPIIALTSQHHLGDYSDLSPQQTNRTVSQLDVKRVSVNLPFIKDDVDEKNAILSVNKALIFATKKGKGPVHINLLVRSLSFTFKTDILPDIPKIDYYQLHDLLDDNILSSIKSCIKNKKICLLIGSHRKFSDKENKAINNFVNTYDVIVLYDNTSNYHGKNKILISLFSCFKNKNIEPDIIIDIGGIIGDPSAPNLRGPEFWRISEDGEIHQRYGKLTKQFDCLEYSFFDLLSDEHKNNINNKYYNSVINMIGEITIPDLPLSNTYISQQMSKILPEGCSLHLGIQNSLRNMDYFKLPENIDSSSNVGGYGIDGAISATIGQSMVDKNKLYFCQIGDLAFFYDMNALGNRHIQRNIRILIINNHRGIEFRLNPIAEAYLGKDTDHFIAAHGHFGSAKAWAESMGFIYLTANNKNEFLSNLNIFCSPSINKFEKPVLFEVFTTVEDEQEGYRLILEAYKPKEELKDKKKVDNIKKIVKTILPSKIVNLIKK